MTDLDPGLWFEADELAQLFNCTLSQVYHAAARNQWARIGKRPILYYILDVMDNPPGS